MQSAVPSLRPADSGSGQDLSQWLIRCDMPDTRAGRNSHVFLTGIQYERRGLKRLFFILLDLGLPTAGSSPVSGNDAVLFACLIM